MTFLLLLLPVEREYQLLQILCDDSELLDIAVFWSRIPVEKEIGVALPPSFD
jgi:hypothetical protein